MTNQNFVAVIGAGPAGLFGARELANQGVRVALFNRDIKPGGLAEYGIYPNKHTMKNGLRKQFRQVLDILNLDYYGNIIVGTEGDLTSMICAHLDFRQSLLQPVRREQNGSACPAKTSQECITPKMLYITITNSPPTAKKHFVLENVAQWSAQEM